MITGAFIGATIGLYLYYIAWGEEGYPEDYINSATLGGVIGFFIGMFIGQ